MVTGRLRRGGRVLGNRYICTRHIYKRHDRRWQESIETSPREPQLRLDRPVLACTQNQPLIYEVARQPPGSWSIPAAPSP